jgi:hypothetical protein
MFRVGPTEENYVYKVVEVQEHTWFYRCECAAAKVDEGHVLWLIYETKDDQVGIDPPSWLAVHAPVHATPDQVKVGQPVWGSREDILEEGKEHRWYRYCMIREKWQGSEFFDDFKTEIL